ncbi:MAG: recombinase family protein [Thermoplasmata archaeon]
MDIAYLILDHYHADLKKIYESRNIKVFSDNIISKDRIEFKDMLDYIQKNRPDKLYVESILDLGKSLIESLKVYIELESHGISIISSSEGFLVKDKDLIKNIFSWILKSNREVINRNVSLGKNKAKSEGKILGGRPLKEIDWIEVQKYRDRKLSYKEISKLMDIPYTTLYHRYLKEKPF